MPLRKVRKAPGSRKKIRFPNMLESHVHSRANCQCAITISQSVTNSAKKIQKLSHHYYKIKKEYY